MRKDEERLVDILESIRKIERYAARGHDAFVRDELLQTWIIHHIEIIGEAAKGISPPLQMGHQRSPGKRLRLSGTNLFTSTSPWMSRRFGAS